MTDVNIKALKFKRKIKLAFYVRKKLAKVPSNKHAVISDLFPIKQDDKWNTEFEFLNIANLILGDNLNGIPHKAEIHFFDADGNHLGFSKIEISSMGRKTLRLAEFLKFNFTSAKTFAVFHDIQNYSLNIGKSFVAERGYCGYEYNRLGVKGYVHGNLDAVTLSDGKIIPIGNKGFISRYFTVQHCLTGPSNYEFIFTNPTSRKVKITPNIMYENSKWKKLQPFSINTKGSYNFNLYVNSGEKVFVRFKSKLYLARPVVFRVSNDSMDVFHG